MTISYLIYFSLIFILCKNFETKRDKIFGPFTKLDYLEMNTEIDKIIDILDYKNNITITDTKLTNHTDSILCKTCLYTFNKFHKLLDKKYGLTLLEELTARVCSLFGLEYRICKKTIVLYGDVVVNSIIEHYFDAEYICTNKLICKFNHYEILSPDNYAKRLLNDKPKYIMPDVDITAPIIKVLHVTDIHTDLYYEEGSNGDCNEPLCCRKSSGVPKGQNTTAGRWGYEGKCDIPFRTLDNFVKNIVENIKPDMIIWTGDNPPHTVWNINPDEIYSITYKFIDLLLNKYKYTGPVFPSLGNHEEFISDQYNHMNIIREKYFLGNMTKLFSNWLSEDEQKLFSEKGYYSKKYLETNLRIISINCFLCDTVNFFLIENPTDPHDQFKWMEEVLRQAERDREYVFIIGHIPPGDTVFTHHCSKRYQALTDRFSSIIRGHFFGHTHHDEMRLLTEYFDDNIITGVIYTAPSLTTYEYQNPSFRVYEIDSNTKIIKNYNQFRLNITEANINPDQEPIWKIAYSAKDVNLIKFRSLIVSI